MLNVPIYNMLELDRLAIYNWLGLYLFSPIVLTNMNVAMWRLLLEYFIKRLPQPVTWIIPFYWSQLNKPWNCFLVFVLSCVVIVRCKIICKTVNVFQHILPLDPILYDLLCNMPDERQRTAKTAIALDLVHSISRF